MASDTSTTASPHLVSGYSACWILVGLALTAVSQPSTCSRRKGRDLFGGKFDLFRCVPFLCLFDGIIDLVVLVRATCQKFSSSPAQDADQGRRRLPPLKPNVAVLMLAIFILAVFVSSIKLFSMKGIPWTQLCASLYFFAILTKLVIDIIRLDTDEYDPELEVIIPPSVPMSVFFQLSALPGLLTLLSQVIMEGAIWYNMSVPLTALVPSDDLSLRTNMRTISFLSASGSIPIFGLFPELRSSMVARSFILVNAMGCICIFSGTNGTMSYESQFEQQIEVRKALLKESLSRFERLGYAIGLINCVGFVSIFMANIIYAIGTLIASAGPSRASRGQSRASSSDAGALPVSEPISSSSGGQQAEPDATGLSTAHGESRSRMSMASRRSQTFETQISRSTRDESVSRTPSWMDRMRFRGTHICRWLKRSLILESNDSTIVAIAIFNLITTACYYFVAFDSTGTESPSWLSFLG